MKNEAESINQDQSWKPRRPKSRQVSSRFLSPTSSPNDHNNIFPSLNQSLSPLHRTNPTQTPTPTTMPSETRKQNKSVDDSGFGKGLWPSSGSSTTSITKLDTLADHLGNERLNDLVDRKDHNAKSANSNTNNALFFNRQRSCTEFSRFDDQNGGEKTAKENHKPIFGGSMRYTGKLRFPGKSSSKSSKKSASSSSTTMLSNVSDIVPGRFSVDENALNRRRISDSFTDTTLDSESECSDLNSSTEFGSLGNGKNSSNSYMSSTMSSRKSGVEVSSKYLIDPSTRPRRGKSESNIPNPVSLDNSPRFNKKFMIKNTIKRANSLTGYGSEKSQWALSPGRSSSPPVSVENKGKLMSFSSLKPPTSTSRAKGVEKLLNMGLDLFKSKKSSSSSNLGSVGSGTAESVHQLRLLHNRAMQWRFVNARAESVNSNLTKQAESNLLCAWDRITKLQHSVLQKKLQLQKEKLEMKLKFLLHSQIKPLEAWGDVERQHLLALSMTKDCLHSVVCRVPLIEGAKVETQSASVALRRASDLSASIKSMLTTFSPEAEKTVSLLSELADVVAQEKSLMEECLELFRIISVLEIQERNLRCDIIQLQLWQQQQHPEMPS